MDIPVGSLLSGYRVLDISAEMGAFCGKFLRDLGLDVIKIEPPKGDPLRSHPPFAEGHDNPEGSLRFAYLNAGKQGITLDLEKPGGRELLLKLVEQADVVIESYPPGYLKSLDLDFPVLKERQEKLIVVGLSGFGQTGPYAHFRAPDIVTTAMSGLLYVSGTPELPPCMPPETQSYYYASIYAAFGAMLALCANAARTEYGGQADGVEPIAVSGNFLWAPDPGEMRVTTTVRKRGRRIGLIDVELTQDGRTAVRAAITMGVPEHHVPPLLSDNPVVPLMTPEPPPGLEPIGPGHRMADVVHLAHGCDIRPSLTTFERRSDGGPPLIEYWVKPKGTAPDVLFALLCGDGDHVDGAAFAAANLRSASRGRLSTRRAYSAADSRYRPSAYSAAARRVLTLGSLISRKTRAI